MNFITLSVINGMIRILQSKKDSDLQLRDFSFSMTMDEPLTEQGDGLEELCLLHFNGMETSAIALTDKVDLELDSQVLSYVKLILLTDAGEYTSAS